MIKESRNSLYKKVGRYLTVAREHRKITVSQLAAKAGEQFNTIQSIEEGNSFYFHQVLWMIDHLGIDITDLIKHIKEDHSGQQDINDFI